MIQLRVPDNRGRELEESPTEQEDTGSMTPLHALAAMPLAVTVNTPAIPATGLVVFLCGVIVGMWIGRKYL